MCLVSPFSDQHKNNPLSHLTSSLEHTPFRLMAIEQILQAFAEININEPKCDHSDMLFPSSITVDPYSSSTLWGEPPYFNPPCFHTMSELLIWLEQDKSDDILDQLIVEVIEAGPVILSEALNLMLEIHPNPPTHNLPSTISEELENPYYLPPEDDRILVYGVEDLPLRALREDGRRSIRDF